MRNLAKRLRAFTLIELLTVMAVIVALAGLTLMGAGWANKKAATSRAEAEIQSLSLALENYKSDQGSYPLPQTPITGGTANYYKPSIAGFQESSRALYQALSGDGDDALLSGSSINVSDGKLDPDRTRYYEFKNKMLGGITSTSGSIGNMVYVQDPFGYPYGYYSQNTIGATGGGAATSGTAPGYNPTFDLWSTAGSTSFTGSSGWIKNW